MKRLALVLVLWACGGEAAAAAPCGAAPERPGPWAASAGLGPGFGLFYATHGRLTLGASRLLWGRLELGAELRLGLAGKLFGLEPALRVGVDFPLSRAARFVLAVRVGYARYRLVEPTRTRWLGAPLTGLVTEVRLPLGRSWELAVAPGCVSFYLQGALWGVVLEPAVGVARRW